MAPTTNVQTPHGQPLLTDVGELHVVITPADFDPADHLEIRVGTKSILIQRWNHVNGRYENAYELNFALHFNDQTATDEPDDESDFEEDEDEDEDEEQS